MMSTRTRWQRAIANDDRLDVYGTAVALALSLSLDTTGRSHPDPLKRPSVATIARRAKVGKTVATKWLGRAGQAGLLEEYGLLDVVERKPGKVSASYQAVLPTYRPTTR
jgi:hypothetical protein